MNFETDKTLAELYDCNAYDFRGKKIEDLRFASTRMLNCFKKNNIFFIDELLNHTGQEIIKYKNWGKKCCEELDLSLNDYISSIIEEKNKKEELKQAIRTGIFSHLENDNNRYSYELIQKYIKAKELLGSELVNCVLDGEPYIKNIYEMLINLIAEVNKHNYYEDLLKKIPRARLEAPLYKLLKLYKRKKIEVQDRDCKLVDYLLNNFSLYSENNFGKYTFINWCYIDLDNELNNYVLNEFKERDFQIIQSRAQGMTLEKIGKKYNVSRERIRQIEKKVIEKLNSWMTRNSFFELLIIDLDSKFFISCKKINIYLKKCGDIFSYVYQHMDSTNYNKKLNGFILDNNKYDECNTVVDSLPERFTDKEFEQIIKTAEESLNDHDDFIKTIILTEYCKTENVYHKSRLTLADIYGEVLKTYFIQGIHISDDKEINLFKKYVFDIYGIMLNQKNRAIGAVISRVGILCDKGIYKFDDGNFISEELVQRIYKYIIDTKAPALLTNTVFEKFKSELVNEGVNNRFFLQGILHKKYADTLYFRRDYISKDNLFVNLYTQINDYIEKFDNPVSKSQIIEAFPGVSEVTVNIAVSDESIINLFGSYIHAKKIDIAKSDIDYLHSILKKAFKTKNTIHCKNIFYYIEKDNPVVLSNNYMFQPFCCYSVLEYLFKDEFTFDRPYIARLGVEVERSSDVIAKYVLESDVLEISDLLAKAREMNYFIQNSLEFIDTCNDTHLMLDKDHIAKITYIGISECDAEEIEMKIDHENIRGTVAMSELKCLQNLPKINTPWSEWLIYSIINKWSKKYEVAASSNQLRFAVPLIARAGEMDTSIDVDNNDKLYFIDDLDNIEALIEDIEIEDIEGI